MLKKRGSPAEPSQPVKRRSLVRRASSDAPAAVSQEPSSGGLYFESEKTHLQFIRSGCTMLDCALGGGWVAGRTSNIVGNKSTGKTQLVLEAIANLFRDYPDAECWYDEPEAAFDEPHAHALAIPIDRVQMINGERTIESTFKRLEGIIADRRKRAASNVCLYALDSLDAKSDEAELDREFNDPSFGAAKAKKLSELFRRSIIDLRETNIHLMVVSQIRDVMNAQAFAKKQQRSGGHALDFYAAQIAWLTYVGKCTREVEVGVGKTKLKRVTGIDVKAVIEKNKIAPPWREAEYELTFNYGIEDDKASKAFLKLVGIVDSRLAGAALRERAIKEWYNVEARLSRTPKYAEAPK